MLDNEQIKKEINEAVENFINENEELLDAVEK